MDGDLVEPRLERLAGRRVDAGGDAHEQGVAGLLAERDVGDADPGVVALEMVGEVERRSRNTLAGAGRAVEVRVQPGVELMVPGDHGPGEARDEEKGRRRQPKPTMQNE